MIGRKCKTVSFDLKDGFEKDLLQHAEKKGKFSKYIKRLIQKDREGGVAIAAAPIDQVPDNYNQDAMAGFL